MSNEFIPEKSKLAVSKRKLQMSAVIFATAAFSTLPVVAQSVDGPSQQRTIETVVVTADKREERVSDVPQSISVISGDDLASQGLVNGADYLRAIPGSNQVEGGYGGQAIVLRGIGTDTAFQNGGSGPTTATYFGETPTTNSAGLLGSSVDLKLVDIQRVEVLRGPQGTSFGDASLGGAVRIIPVAPKLGEFEASLGAGYSNTSGFGSDNGNIQGSVNIPIIDNKLAIRAVAYEFSDSGYYRNVAGSDRTFQSQVAVPMGAQAFAVDQNQAGTTNVLGGRISALYQATDDLKFTINFLSQRSKQDGWPVSTSIVPYEQALLEVAPQHILSGHSAGGSNVEINIGNAMGEYNLGWANLVATYSYVTGGTNNSVPATFIGLPFPDSFEAGPSLGHRENVGELRIVTQLSSTWNFLGGLYYDQQTDKDLRTYYWYGDPAKDFYAPGQTNLGFFNNLHNGSQKAAYGEVTWEFLPGVTLLGGARYYDFSRNGTLVSGGPLFGASSSTPYSGGASGFVGRANLSYKVTPDILLYAGWDQGFRLGQIQAPVTATACQCSLDGIHIGSTNVTLASTGFVKDDSVNSYTLGGKFALFDHRLAIDADVFLTDWSNVPLSVLAGASYAYTTNGGDARTLGLELQTNYLITDSLRLDAGGSWLNANLTEISPNVHGAAVGSRLPGSPRFNANLGLQYNFDIASYAASIRADSIYVGTFYGDILESPNLKSGGYATMNLTGHIAIKDFDLALYVHNLSDNDSYTFRGSFNFVGSNYGYRLRPRTFGVQLGYNL